ncbi:ferredoxin--NADP reductase [Aliidiomarina celeris]|uniref:ferredoxin--NADP reductase n=1 Tax=Aliidiomarina celeris TaxID=2249428 RepID=UPI000DEB4468|nr:ferredoxin--NADP reductase [Aliidiomarina celeris]
MINWLTSTVSDVYHWTPTLFSLRLGQLTDSNGNNISEFSFQPGQFVRIGVESQGEVLHRAYSLVNAPNNAELEFVITAVPNGTLSPVLNQLHPGARVLVAENASGFFGLGDIPSAESLWLMSTGTGIGPYLSMLRASEPWQRFPKIVLVHAVRHANELCYQPLIEQWQHQHQSAFHYQPVVSREDCPGALRGRIPGLIHSGLLEQTVGTPLNTSAQVMLCGNPEMIKETRAELATRGLILNLRRKPGNVTLEQYWK